MFFVILIIVIYIWIILSFSSKTREAIKRTSEKNNAISAEKIILKASFSSKAFNYFSTSLIFSFVMLAVILIYLMSGRNAVASLLNIDENVCRVIYGAAWLGFLFLSVITVFYTWVNTVVSNQLLAVTDKKIFGTSCCVKGLKIHLLEFEINISDITDVISINGENALGININTFNIITNTGKYEYIMISDGEEIKRIINKKRLSA